MRRTYFCAGPEESAAQTPRSSIGGLGDRQDCLTLVSNSRIKRISGDWIFRLIPKKRALLTQSLKSRLIAQFVPQPLSLPQRHCALGSTRESPKNRVSG